jgi:PAS domain S-box-containing protein
MAEHSVAKIVIVSGGDGATERIGRELEQAGYETIVCRTAEEARRKLGEETEAPPSIEEHCRSFLESFRGVAFRIGADCRPVFIQGAIEALTGYTEAEFTSGHITLEDILPTEELPVIASHRARLIEAPGTVIEYEHPIRRKQGDLRWIRQLVQSVAGDDGNLKWLQGTAYDVTSRKLAELRLEESERRFRCLADHTGDALVVLAGDLSPMYLSPATTRVFGYSMEDASSLTVQDVINPEDLTYVMEQIERRRIERPEHTTLQLRIYTKAGELRWIENNTTNFYDGAGTLSKAVISVRDITERKRIEEQLQMALIEEDRLMGEINHRVKNNLAMIASLISLKDDAIGEAADLSDIKDQVRAIGLIHEKLYRSDSVTHIDVGDYLQDLLQTTFYSGGYPSATLDYAVPPASLPSKTATSLGLIVNELATNAMKHGFQAGGDARFTVTLSEVADDEQYVLEVANTGVAFPPDVELHNASTLGLRLVSALVGQLRGTIELRRRPSARFTIRFPK